MILMDPSKSDKVCRTDRRQKLTKKKHGARGNDSRYMKDSLHWIKN